MVKDGGFRKPKAETKYNEDLAEAPNNICFYCGKPIDLSDDMYELALREVLKKLISLNLTDPQDFIILLREVQGYTQKEIAEELGFETDSAICKRQKKIKEFMKNERVGRIDRKTKG